MSCFDKTFATASKELANRISALSTCKNGQPEKSISLCLRLRIALVNSFSSAKNLLSENKIIYHRSLPSTFFPQLLFKAVETFENKGTL